ncbi:probable G-protein coupled receptor 158 isoform X2 [Pangasianodon hypophthalmus]|uniref:probable G-protein coupled receptor 158 isoform X2 n=1 Tax=Pangasianodon hypophthalmus TaxID=310915 RepID=UPI0023071494|nr:probable G-protein coupled receptor 158 isoform X2 [Pangasianodon hypophthalmus]
MAVIRLSLLLQVGFVVGAHCSALAPRTDEHHQLHHQHQYHHHHQHQQQQQQLQHQQLPRVVAAFLHTGDPSALERANCTGRYELSVLRAGTRAHPHPAARPALHALTHAASFLRALLRERERERNLVRDLEWCRALVRSVVDGDARIYRAAVVFDATSASASASAATGSAAHPPRVFLQATRRGGDVVLQDLSASARDFFRNETADTEWYHAHRRKTRHGEEGHVDESTHVKWSAPFLECEAGSFVPRWLLSLSTGFHGLKPNLTPEFRGVVRLDISLQDVDIDQCSTDGWFAGTHRCNLTSMECLPISGHGFVLDKYKCQCKSGFYHPSRVAINGVKRKAVSTQDPAGSSLCLPCQEGCVHCKDDTPCVAQGEGYLRIAVLAFQGICMLLDFISMVLLYHFRRNKSIRASGLVLLEAILFGALLLYFPGVVLYFQPSVFRCILLRWVRMLGFATVYGTVTLKLYRVLKVFLSRTAQRIPYMTSWKVLCLLCIILLIVLWFLVAWTLAVCQNPDWHLALITVGFTPEGLQFSMCLLDRWDYMMAVAEFLFLLWSVYLCYAVRTVPSAFHEPRYMTIAVHNELIISAIFHVIRFTFASELHPDWMLMLFFAHTHLTVTVTLGLLLFPKFLFAGTHLRDDIATEAYEDELDMGRSGSYLNSSITSAWSEHSLDPEDIREELKKLYSQLEIYKRKKMLANNPHLQKKRSSKKGLGRSLMRRITEIPETMGRQHSREDKELGEHGSNRNSICVLRKNPFEPSHSAKPAKEESLKNKVFSLKKSHSSYDHVRDQSEDSSSSATDKMEISTTEGSLLETLMGKKLVKKKSSEKIDVASESTESVPLVCKSASAHNLTADKKPLHPRTSMLQKSLSVIASAKERTLGLAGKTQSIEDPNKNIQQKNKEAKSPVENEENYTKMIISQSVEYKQTAGKAGIMKHQVSESQLSICSEPAKGKDVYNISEVCPWELEDLPTPSENRVQKHVSIAAEESTTIHSNSTKAAKQQKQKGTGQSPSSTRRPNQKPIDRADICSWEEGSKESQGQTDGTKPNFSSQPAQSQIQTSTDRTKSQKADVCPWDFDELPKKSIDSTYYTDQGRSKTTSAEAKTKSSTAVTDVKGKGTILTEGKAKDILPETKSSGSSLQTSSKEDTCPWDYESTSPTLEKIPSLSQVSKMKETTATKKGTAPMRTFQKEKEKTKGTEDEKVKTKSRDKSSSGKPTERPLSQAKLAEICPWDEDSSHDMGAMEKQKSPNTAIGKTKQAAICPWDFEDPATTKEVTRNTGSSIAKQRSPNSKGVPSGAKMADVCPWDFDDQTSTKKA